MIAQQTKYRPIADLHEEMFGHRPHVNTIRRWIRGENLRRGQTQALRVVRVGRAKLTTREWLEEFLTIQVDVSRVEPSATKQAKSKAKADAVAESICEAFKV